jgi:hypothetical protein
VSRDPGRDVSHASFPTRLTSPLVLLARVADWPSMAVTGAVAAGAPSFLSYQACPIAGLDRKAESTWIVLHICTSAVLSRSQPLTFVLVCS